MRISFYMVADATTPGQVDGQLPKLLGKLLQLGQRIELRCPDVARMDRLSDLIWKTPVDGFTAHAASHQQEFADLNLSEHQLYLTNEAGNPSKADILVRLSGADENIEGYGEVLEIFSGLEADKAAARLRWKSAKERDDAELRYFALENGRWMKKA